MDCFQFLIIVNKSDINIHVQIAMWNVGIVLFLIGNDFEEVIRFTCSFKSIKKPIDYFCDLSRASLR